MKRITIITVGLLVLGVGVAFSEGGFRNIRERLTGLREVPVISTTGHGTFSAEINDEGTEISFRLTYADLEGQVQQAHIHFGATDTNGGISVFLCTNLGNGPAGTQACPPSPATVTGTLSAKDVVGPAAQGIEPFAANPNSFDELITAIRAGKTHAKVHSTKWPGGEIRQQLRGSNEDDPTK
jgi:hypothetical protein